MVESICKDLQHLQEFYPKWKNMIMENKRVCRVNNNRNNNDKATIGVKWLGKMEKTVRGKEWMWMWRRSKGGAESPPPHLSYHHNP